MAVTAQFLKGIMAEARPIIERQMNDATIIAGLRTVVANAGGDWGALKALIKAHVEDENDETGEGKRVRKIRDKADSTSAYADMLGLANMNEKNFSAKKGEITEQPETANQSATSEGESDAIAKSADDRNVSENNLIDGAGQAGQEAGRQPPVETCNDEAPTESAADTISAPNFTGPQLPAVPGGEPSKPSSDDGGAKTDGGDAAIPVRSDDQSAYRSTQSEQAANPIPDDDVPAFLKKDRAERNERCEKPLTCQFGHHPQKVTCSTCTTAWQIARRKAVAA